MEIFEKASRLKLRFEFRGMLAVEDLWDLPLAALDTIYKRLNAQAKMAKEDSLLEVRSDADKIVDLSIEIVKRVVTVRLEELEARKVAAANKAKKEKILEILEKKQDASLEGKSEEELRALAESL